GQFTALYARQRCAVYWRFTTDLMSIGTRSKSAYMKALKEENKPDTQEIADSKVLKQQEKLDKRENPDSPVKKTNMVVTDSPDKKTNDSTDMPSPKATPQMKIKREYKRSSPKSFECPTCSKVFGDAWKFERHLRVHTGEKPFQCDICSRTFADKSTLRAHTLKVNCSRKRKSESTGEETVEKKPTEAGDAEDDVENTEEAVKSIDESKEEAKVDEEVNAAEDE
ncbi:unnamed protein product, partial [Owenia fusiformis]